MPKVLIVTYYWPPGSGAGVQRWLKFSKYLPEHEWEPVVLTVDPKYAAYPAVDRSLEKEIPENLLVFKTKATDYFRLYSRDKSRIPSSGFAAENNKGFKGYVARFIRGNFFIPDPRRGWNKYAVNKASEIIETTGINHLITTSPPHSTQLIGLELKKKYPALRWIADLRDPWTDIYYYREFYPTFFSRMLDLYYEKSVLQKADSIITVGRSLKDIFASKVRDSNLKIEIIQNGYDNEDFSGLSPTRPMIFTISYIGTLSDMYNTKGFFNVLKDLNENGIDFRLRFIGYVSDYQKNIIRLSGLDAKTEFLPYSDHSVAVRSMLDSSALLLVIPEHKSSKSIITGKLFEYLASGKPVICLGPPDGDAAGILRDCSHGQTFGYSDAAGIYDYIKAIISNPDLVEKKAPEIYSRRNIVRNLVALLNQK